MCLFRFVVFLFYDETASLLIKQCIRVFFLCLIITKCVHISPRFFLPGPVVVNANPGRVVHVECTAPTQIRCARRSQETEQFIFRHSFVNEINTTFKIFNRLVKNR